MLGVRYYTARCGVWVKCCYELKKQTELLIQMVVMWLAVLLLSIII